MLTSSPNRRIIILRLREKGFLQDTLKDHEVTNISPPKKAKIKNKQKGENTSMAKNNEIHDYEDYENYEDNSLTEEEFREGIEEVLKDLSDDDLKQIVENLDDSEIDQLVKLPKKKYSKLSLKDKCVELIVADCYKTIAINKGDCDFEDYLCHLPEILEYDIGIGSDDADDEEWEVRKNDDGTYIIYEYCGEDSDVTIPATIGSKAVSVIGESAFADRDDLTSITIPNGVKVIDRQAFCCCTSLENVTIPKSVTMIGDYAFCECDKLTSIVLPNGVKTLGDSVFAECSSLTSIKIPNSVTELGEEAFSGCSSLKSITIPNRVVKIEYQAFCDCSELVKISIPDSVIEIDTDAFANCHPDLTIYTSAGSYAEEYARRNGIQVTISSH